MMRLTSAPRAYTWALVTLFLAIPAGGDAQAHPTSTGVDDIRRIQSVEPRSGPPGTIVRMYMENLPFQGSVILGIGAIGAGFEALEVVEQGSLGEVGGSVVVPVEASWDHPLVLITFNGNFAPTAHSDPFHVTDERGLIQRTGTVTDEGEGCLAMRDEHGYFYTLVGPMAEADPGESIRVEGTFWPTGICAQGETILIEGIERVPTSP